MAGKKATTAALEALHNEIAGVLTDALRSIKSASKETGEVPRGAAAILNVARQFIKDNGIEASPAADSPLGNLVAELPFDTEADERAH